MIKQRKLFAILTLVAFMMTFLPIAAFAADTTVSLGYSDIYSDDNYADADNIDVAEFGIQLKNSKGETSGVTLDATSSETLVVWAERSTDQVSDVDTFVDKNGNDFPAAKIIAGKAMINLTDEALAANGGEIKFGLKSNKAGVVKIKAAIVDSVPTTNYQTAVIDRTELHFSDSATTEFEAKRTGWKLEFEQTKPVNEDDAVPANGLDKFEFDVFLKEGSNAIQGEKVKFTVNKSGALLNTSEEITDKRGKVELSVTATKNDTYVITAEAGSVTKTKEVTFGSAQAFDIRVSDQPDGAVALDTDPGIEFQLYDTNGNLIENVSQYSGDGGELDDDKFHQVVSKPSGSKVEDSDLHFKGDEDVLELVFGRYPDKVGNYKVKAALDNGKNVIVSFEVKEQGKIVNMSLDIKEDRIAWNKKTNSPTVKLYDADGTYKKESKTSLSSYTWTVSNTALASVLTDGDEAGRIKAKNGSDNNYKTGTVTVTVLDEGKNLSATDTVVIGSDVSGVKIVEAGKAKIGEKATMKLQIIDADGNNIALDANEKEKIEVDVYKISAPADAEVDWNLPIKSTYRNTLSRTGELVFDATSNVVGEVEFQVVIKQELSDNDEDNIAMSIPVTAEFTATAPADAAKNVTLVINSPVYIVDGATMTSDVSPFIRDNRTFVPVRVLANALGANNDGMWDPATETVTFVREDMTATAVIGSSTITIDKDGVETTITSDVAPFIKDGRAVLPFRVMAEIFGADVTAHYAADGTTASVTYELK